MSIDESLSTCVTGFSGSGACGNRVCCESQGVECCGDCEFYGRCNSACGWYTEEVKKNGMVEKPYWKGVTE